MKNKNKIFLFLVLSVFAWGVLYAERSDAQHALLIRQIDDYANPVISYNLGCAAYERGAYGACDLHFAHATRYGQLAQTPDRDLLHESYFNWAQAAVAAGREKNLTLETPRPDLERARDLFVRARERYTNALVYRENDERTETARKHAQEAEMYVRALLRELDRREAEKKEKEEQKNQQQNEQNNQSNNQQDQQQEKQDQDSQNQQQDQQSERDQKKEENKDQNREQKSDQRDDQKSQDQERDKKTEEKSEPEKSHEQHQEERTGDTPEEQKQESGDDGKPQEQPGDKQEQEASAPEKAPGEEQRAQQEQAQEENAREEQAAQEAQAAQVAQEAEASQAPVPSEKDMREMMAVRLLESLDEKGAALQKALMHKKSSSGNDTRDLKRHKQW